jgi:uncharacterized protein (DUF924 family)
MRSSELNANTLYDYWFGSATETTQYIEGRAEIWFKKDPIVDAYIEKNFSCLLEAYSQKQLSDWHLTAKSKLTLIIALDQIPRHLYRNSPLAHKFDIDALTMSLHLIQTGFSDSLNSVEKLFLYLPLQHSEMIAIQNLSVKKFTELLYVSPIEWRDFFSIVLDMAKRHHEVIQKFGRFPHRNSYLKRTSSLDELEILKNPKYCF